MVQRLRALVGLLAVLVGCGGETVAPAEPAENPAALYWQLTLNQKAINLSTAAPYDTFRLVATPRNLNGEPLELSGELQFASADLGAVQVTPDGLVRGVLDANRIRVVATLTDGVVTHADTALVSVTTNPTPPVLERLSLEPDPPSDSAKGTRDGQQYYPPAAIAPRTLDAGGNELGLAVWVTSSDPRRANYDNEQGTLGAQFGGQVTFVAQTWAYGVALKDTLEYTVGLPLWSTSQVESRLVFGSATPVYQFSLPTITVGTGAYVWWWRTGDVPPFDVIFDDPAGVAPDTVFGTLFPVSTPCGATAGDIATFGDPSGDVFANICSRHFPVPGTYLYHSSVLNAAGAIIVVDERQAAVQSR